MRKLCHGHSFRSGIDLLIPALALAGLLIAICAARGETPTSEPAQSTESTVAPASGTADATIHPALFLVGDSIMKTGTAGGERGPWGWGSEIVSLFDPAKIQVYNEAHGGRSSRSFIAEGLWAKILERIQPSDYLILQFGHNDSANSKNYPDRISAKGSGDETQEVKNPPAGTKQAVHTYGWYLKQYVADAQAKGATVIICSPVPRNTWVDGKMKRGFDGYSKWAADASKASGAKFIDLNALAADRFDALGQQTAAAYFADSQHTTKAGARLNAEAVVEGLKQLTDCKLADDLKPSPSESAQPDRSAAPNDPGSARASGPDPKEIPIPQIQTSLGTMPGVDELPVRTELPDVLTMNDGIKVTSLEQWSQRREEMKRILEYYAVGLAPPPPGNVKGAEVKSQMLLNGRVKYRLVHLTFGPAESLSLDIGIFTPTEGGPFPALISPGGTPPGATPLSRLPQGPGQGKGVDALLAVGPDPQPAKPTEDVRPQRRASGEPADPEAIAARNPALAHGFAYVTFNNNDCGEDTTLRNADGSWAFRTTRFYPAYPGYDWGLLRGWAWGVSRIVDYLQTDPSIDKSKLIVSGVSRTGKSALIAGAFDDRLAMVAPVASSGGGTPAFRFSGAEHGGKEGLSEMMRKYPNWFSPHLHEFWGHAEKLPFDEHWLIALVAPRPFIALEGNRDQNVNFNGVKQSWLAAKPAYALFGPGVIDRLGASWADRPHGMVQGDWDALLSFADKFLLDKQVERRFDEFPEEPISATTDGAKGPTSSH
jgi:lysophospholipase L1-like esterase